MTEQYVVDAIAGILSQEEKMDKLQKELDEIAKKIDACDAEKKKHERVIKDQMIGRVNLNVRIGYDLYTIHLANNDVDLNKLKLDIDV